MPEANDRFIALYNELDEAIRTKYSQGNTSYSAINFYIGKLRKTGGKRALETAETLDALRELRNSLVHMVRIGGEEPFEVSGAALEALGGVLSYLEDPPLLIEKAIPYERLLYCYSDTKVLSLIRTMSARGISHVPLLDGKRCIGVFSESAFCSFLSDYPDAPLEKLVISDLGEYVYFSPDRAERYEFVAKDYLLEDALRVYMHSKAETGKRLGLFLITESGNRKEKLLAAAAVGGLE